MGERAGENKREAGKTGEEFEFMERRQGDDWMTKAITVFTGLGWGFAIAMVIIFSNASPEKENFFTRIFNIQVSGYWNEQMLSLSLNTLIAAFSFCMIGIVFSILRHRRSTDHLNKPLVVLCAASAVGIVVMVTYFADYFK
jgi:ABC-type proline/glycine betaine transport system permease subunit